MARALLQMIVMPLIFISIVSAFSKIEIGDKFAKKVVIFSLFNWYSGNCCDCRYHLRAMFGLDASSIDLVEHSRGTEMQAS